MSAPAIRVLVISSDPTRQIQAHAALVRQHYQPVTLAMFDVALRLLSEPPLAPVARLPFAYTITSHTVVAAPPAVDPAPFTAFDAVILDAEIKWPDGVDLLTAVTRLNEVLRGVKLLVAHSAPDRLDFGRLAVAVGVHANLPGEWDAVVAAI